MNPFCPARAQPSLGYEFSQKNSNVPDLSEGGFWSEISTRAAQFRKGHTMPTLLCHIGQLDMRFGFYF